MADTAEASGAADAVLVKMTQDGRNVEVISGQVCLAGVGEADHRVPLPEHRNPQMIAHVLPGGPRMWPAGCH
ncbi:hypothetical protein [Paraburkholderia rhynchosiae]|uniref:Uncharacterized protein n=1 Tax=Paraburkholderia rhynchosiae TaxID=487049 RepID=A0A6J5AT70_9BURK|nr:hypothetical protein [Paraburkholderia rhynchosiae]CAB3670651.1 hypothetical protein LMG27174_02137 [Paraburkholderia rhynchosiae]